MQEIIIDGGDVEFFTSPKEYKQQLLLLIENARQRIFITALYLQDDDAGQEVLSALYQAKANFPDLVINIFVDFNRGQRGLIGAKASLGNRELYLKLAKQYSQTIHIYGVAVKRKEVFGVLHLKGMVFDDKLFYTGASINDIYFHQADRYRLDRYCTINSLPLADSFCHYLIDTFIDSGLAPQLNLIDLPDALQQKKNLALLKQKLKNSHYPVNTLSTHSDLSTGRDSAFISPLVGFGRNNNQLNQATRKLVQGAGDNMVIFTPYFNLPHALARDVIRALKRGVKTTMVVGDKTANDFYITEIEDFSTIGIVPYIYEMLLRRFVKRYQNFIDKGLLNIYLWKDGVNSFHLKGVRVDDRHHLITGSNLNPRAWALDLENGLLLDDVNQLFLSKTDEELQGILANTIRVRHFSDIEGVNDYPEKPQKLLKKIRVTQIDRVLKRFL